MPKHESGVGIITPSQALDTGQPSTGRRRSADLRRPESQAPTDNQQSEGRVLVDDQLNAAAFVPTDQLNTSSLGHFVGSRSEGQVLAEVHLREGQALMNEQLNAAAFVPIDQLNTLSLGNFVGQRSKDHASTPGQQDVNDQHQPGQPRWTMQWEVMRSMLGLRSHAQPDLLPHPAALHPPEVNKRTATTTPAPPVDESQTKTCLLYTSPSPRDS